MSKTVFEKISRLQDDRDVIAERDVQLDSVLMLLRDAKDKLRISMILPRLLNNPFGFRNCVKDQKTYEQVFELMNKCFAKLKAIKKIKDIKTMNTSDLVNHETISLIDFLQHNHAEFDIPKSWEAKLDEYDHSLLSAMDLLYNITEQRFRRTASEELTREKEIHRLHYESEALQSDIENMKEKALKQKSNQDWKTGGREVVMRKLEEELAFKKWDNNVRVQTEIAKSNQVIKSVHNASIQRQKELEEELERTKKDYDKLLQENLETEKRTRAEKNKLLLQLQSLIKKYDTTIGSKMKESIRLSEEYEAEKKVFDKFMIEFNKEEERYDRIVRSREEEEKRVFEQKLALFIMNRAAKLIQRSWRNFRREKYGIRKVRGKGKGKKK